MMLYLPVAIVSVKIFRNFFAETKIDCIFAVSKSENSSVGRA